mgnify:CR=1 FL=1
MSRETTNTYHSDCGLYVCNLITFTVANDIPGGSTFVFTTQGVNNPISVKPVSDVKIATQMRYAADSRYYNIDYISTNPTWSATVGTIDPASMVVLRLDDTVNFR